MKDKEEQSAIDKIYKIEEDLEYIKKYLILLDNNLKLISNKLNKIQQKEPVAKQITATPGTPLAPREKSDKLILGKIKVFGYVINTEKFPLENIEINVYDESNSILKQRKTDKNGYWEVRLPVGKYGVEYIQSGYHPVNKIITLDKTMSTFEV